MHLIKFIKSFEGLIDHTDRSVQAKNDEADRFSRWQEKDLSQFFTIVKTTSANLIRVNLYCINICTRFVIKINSSCTLSKESPRNLAFILSILYYLFYKVFHDKNIKKNKKISIPDNQRISREPNDYIL